MMKRINFRLAISGIITMMLLWPLTIGAATDCNVTEGTAPQGITMTVKDQPLPAVLKSIERAGGKSIIFNYEELEMYRVSATVTNKSEAEAIRIVISGKPLTLREREHYFIVQRSDKEQEMKDIHGRVVNTEGAPMAYSTVLLLRRDSTVIDGCITDNDGWFHIVGNYSPVALKASFLGHHSKAVDYCDGQSHVIVLSPDAIALQDVTVTNEKPLTQSTERGILVNIIGTPLSKMGMVSEMIKHLPLMLNDGTVAGHGKPQIYINNKKVRNDSELERLSAGDILTAEVITVPGVEYGMEVTSVIRLKTTRRAGEGLSGSVSTAYRQGKRSYNNQNVALNYRTDNGMDFFAKGFFTQSNTLVEATSSDYLKASSVWNFPHKSQWETSNNYYFADLGYNWDIDDNNSVGITYTAFNYIGDGKNKSSSDEDAWRDNTFVEHLESSSLTRWKPRMSHTLNAYYVGKIGKWGFDLNADYYRSSSLSEMTAETNATLMATSNTDVRNQLIAEKLIVTAPVPKGSLTFGEETSFVDRTSAFEQNGFSADSHICQRTAIWSLFANYTLQMNKVTLNAGVRWQNEDNHYDVDGVYNSAMSPDYSVLLPRISATYINKDWRHTLSYKVSRFNPPYSLLSPAVNYRSKYEYDTGNPFLQPQTTHSVSYAVSWKWIYVEPYYSYSKNTVNSFQYVYDDVNHPGVRMMDYRNVPKLQTYGITLNFSPKIGFWQTNTTAEVGFSDRDVEALGITHKWNDLLTSFNSSNSFSLPHAWMFNITGSLSPYARTGAAKIKTSGQVDLRLNKSFLKNKSLNVAVMAKDILKTAYIEMTAYGGINVSTAFKEYRDVRRFGIDVSYKFNATNSRYKGSHAGQSERNRL